MKNDFLDYRLFFKFIESFAPQGFKGINPEDPLLFELEKITTENNQFFFLGDMIQMKIEFTSNRSYQMTGVKPEELSPYHFFETTHPDDLQRHNLTRVKLFKLGQTLYVAEKGFSIISTNFRLRNPTGGYAEILMQGYLFFSTFPIKTTYILQVNTNIDWWKKSKKNVNHYYIGNDLSHFRYPDEDLLKLTVPYSDREFEIIRLIESGLSSEQIAEKIFLSVHTVNTHRRNILSKSGKDSMSELIYDLLGRGVL